MPIARKLGLSFFILALPLSSFGKSTTPPFKVENIKAESLEVLDKGQKVIISEYNVLKKPSLRFPPDFKGEDCRLGNVTCAAGMLLPLELQSAKIQEFPLSFKMAGQEQKILIQLLPNDFPKFTVIGKSALDKPLIFAKASRDILNPQKPSHLFILSPEGRIQFYQKMPGLTFDFRPHLVNGKKYYSYLLSKNIYHGVTFSGPRVILDENFQVVKTLNEEMDVHEFEMHGPDWYMTTQYSLGKSPLNTDFVNQEIVEVKNGKELFKWSTMDLYKENFFAALSLPYKYKDKFSVQQFHLNAFKQLPNNELLVSMGFDCVMLLDKTTKKVKWVFGGLNDQFGIRGTISPFFHHTPHFDPKTQVLTLFNNGNNTKRSQVLRYSLDVKNRKVKKYEILADPGIWAMIMGSVEVDGDIHSIGFGSRDIGSIDFIEQKGTQRTMSISFEDPLNTIYRVYR